MTIINQVSPKFLKNQKVSNKFEFENILLTFSVCWFVAAYVWASLCEANESINLKLDKRT